VATIKKIDVYELYTAVYGKLEKSHAGYGGDTDFTERFNRIQLFLFDRLSARFEEDQRLLDHLQPFVQHSALLNATDGFVEFPKDYAHRIALSHVYIESPATCTDPVLIQPRGCKYVTGHQIFDILDDSVAFPSIPKKRFYHVYRNEGIQLYPKELKACEMTYLRQPKAAKLVFDLTDNDGDKFTYNQSKSEQPEWNNYTFPLIEAAMLMDLGVELKDEWLLGTYAKMLD
jgi:hypothetical protein